LFFDTRFSECVWVILNKAKEILLQVFHESIYILELSIHNNNNKLISLSVCGTEFPEPTLPPPEPLLSQFAARPVFVVGEVDDERLSSTYWLAPPPVDEADQDMDQVRWSY
jgi:hypothetical protein